MTIGETPRAIRDLRQRDACRVARGGVMGGVIDRIDVSAGTDRHRTDDLSALGSAAVDATISNPSRTLPVDHFDHLLVDTEVDPDE